MKTILFLLCWLGGAAMHTVVELHLKARKVPRQTGQGAMGECPIRDSKEL